MTIYEKVRQLIHQRSEQQTMAEIADIKQLVVALAAEHSKKSQVVEPERILAIIEKAGLTVDDLDASVAEYQRRCKLAAEAARLEELSAAAEAARLALKAADEEEGRRRLEAHRRLQELAAAERELVRQSSNAVAAQSNLIAGAATTDEEQQLSRRLQEIGRSVALIDSKLSRSMGHVDAGSAPDVVTHPGALLYQTQRELSQLGARNNSPADTPEIRARLKNRLKVAQAECARLEGEKRIYQSEIDKINARLVELAADKLKPENFQIIRRRGPSRDQLAKQQAESLGFSQRVMENPISVVRGARR